MEKEITKLLYTEKSLPLILEALELSVTINGYVIDSSKLFVLDLDGNKFKPEQLIGIYKGNFITKEHQLVAFLNFN